MKLEEFASVSHRLCLKTRIIDVLYGQPFEFMGKAAFLGKAASHMSCPSATV